MSLVAQHFSELYMHDVRLLGICTISLNFLSTLQWQRQGRAWGPPPPPPPLFLDQTEKIWGETSPPAVPPPSPPPSSYLRGSMTASTLSQGLDPALH